MKYATEIFFAIIVLFIIVLYFSQCNDEPKIRLSQLIPDGTIISAKSFMDNSSI